MSDSEDREASVWVFTGRIHPEWSRLEVHGITGTLDFEPIAWRGTFTLDIIRSNAFCVCNGIGDDRHVLSLRNKVVDVVNSVIDVLGYYDKCGYSFEITNLFDPHGVYHVFGVDEIALGSDIVTHSVDVNRSLNLTGQSDQLRLALANLRHAIREPGDTGFYCARAIEAIRQHFASGRSRDESWPLMRRSLKVSETALKSFREFDRAQRHGESPWMSGEERGRALQTSWRIVDRFIAFLDRGAEELDGGEFEEI